MLALRASIASVAGITKQGVIVKRCVHLLSCFVASMLAAQQGSAAEIDLEAAQQGFRAAQELCTADAGRLWGVSLCGPMMFVDPQSRAVVANQADARGALHEAAGVFTGSLPTEVNVASTATQWSGVSWSQITWPLPPDPSRRNTLLMHELFHRIQDQVAIPTLGEAANAHLDTLEGRYLMQLEWRALNAALGCAPKSTCRQALADALVFRLARYQLFPMAAEQERALELNEGMAEYTGVVAGNRTRAEQIKAAQWDLGAQVTGRTFVRSFAYATGPALGVLLDGYSSDWRSALRSGPSLHELLQRAAAIRVPRDVAAAATAAAPRYDGAKLRSAEVEREQQRQQTLAANRAKFIAGPILVIPMPNASIQFNPSNLQPLAEAGTVYPTLRISDDWGVLEVSQGALLRPDWKAVSVVAPEASALQQQPLAAHGWTLELKPGWQIVAGARSGDFTLAQVPR